MPEITFFSRLPDASGMFEVASFDSSAEITVGEDTLEGTEGCHIISGDRAISVPAMKAAEVLGAFAAAVPRNAKDRLIFLPQKDLTRLQLRRSGAQMPAPGKPQ